jgi:hypothetical protein
VTTDGSLRAAASGLAAAALQRVLEPATGRVRVEDYLTVLGAMTGEAAVLATGIFDLETTELPPGSPIFGDPMNQVLTGDTANLASVPPDSVVGILLAELVPGTYALAAIPPLEDLYAGVAAGVGAVEWGKVPLSVPAGNAPFVLPIRVAFELRPEVDAAVASLGLDRSRRHVPCTLALADGLRQVQAAIDPSIALRLVLEVVFGTAKMIPMSRRAFEAAGGAPA